jgi:photosystem II stability/assembly factor-like uncharacterized protein
MSRSVVLPPVSLGLDGGPAIALAVDPQAPNILYAGTYGGMFKSIDSGANWFPIRVGFGSCQQIQAVAVDPRSSNIVYSSCYKDYLYKSTDAGATWTPVYLDAGKTTSVIYSITVDPYDSQRIFLGLRLILNHARPPYDGYIYRSTDGGSTWANVSSAINFEKRGSGYYYPYAVTANPFAQNTLFAAYDVSTSADGSGLYRSTDGGTSWVDMTDLTSASGSPKGRDVIISPNYLVNGTLYYAAWGAGCTSDKPYDLMRGYDQGTNWNLGGSCSVDFLKMAMTQSAPIYLYTATQSYGLWRFLEGSGTVDVIKTQSSNTNLAASNVSTVVVDPTNGNNIYVGARTSTSSILTDTNFLNVGIYKTTNGNAALPTWSLAIHGINQTWVTGLYAAVGNSNRLFMASYISGIFESTNLGSSWTPINTGMPTDNTLAMVLTPAGDRLFALTNANGLYTLLPGGASWSKVTSAPAALTPDGQPAAAFPAGHPFAEPELPDADVNPPQPAPRAAQALPASVPLLTMQFAPSSPSTAYIGTSGSGVYKSLDGGLSWTSAGLAGDIVTALTVHPTAPSTVYVVSCSKSPSACPTDALGTVLYSVKVTTNAGANWTTLSLPTLASGSLYAYTAAFSPADPTVLYVGTSNGIYTYSSASSTWAHLGLAGVSVTVVAQNPLSPGRLYAGTTNGAYLSIDAGQSWVADFPALAGLTVTGIQFDPNTPTTVLFATKMGGGLLVR